MNPLQQIPASVRRWLYLAYGLAGLVLGCLAIYGIDVSKPTSVLIVVGTAFGFTAASNITDASTVAVTAPAEVTFEVTGNVDTAAAVDVAESLDRTQRLIDRQRQAIDTAKRGLSR